MTINWRALFDHLRVPWRDRGANCSRGHVNCRCPFCGNADPSFHLTVKEDTGEYYCFRSPGTHSGRSLPWLLLHLGVAAGDAIDAVIEQHSDRRMPAILTATPPSPVRWDRFEPAAEHPAALAYLEERGYASPEKMCQQYDLRFTRSGRFAWRVLLPLTYEGQTTGFTGRTIADATPRYLTNDPTSGSLYLPAGRHVVPPRVLLLCEGPFDALTVARACSRADVLPAALLGTAIPAERKLHISSLARGVACVVYVPDADQAVSNTYRLIAELELIPGVKVKRVPVPRGHKDIAEMTTQTEELQRWLRTVMDLSYPSGQVSSRTTRGPSLSATLGG